MRNICRLHPAGQTSYKNYLKITMMSFLFTYLNNITKVFFSWHCFPIYIKWGTWKIQVTSKWRLKQKRLDYHQKGRIFHFRYTNILAKNDAWMFSKDGNILFRISYIDILIPGPRFCQSSSLCHDCYMRT